MAKIVKNITDRNRKDLALFAALVLLILYGYISGDLQKTFAKHSAKEISATEQNALDHIFGSDMAFDPSADNVTKTVAGKQDNISWKMLAKSKLSITSQDALVSADIKKLDGQEITITGYIFPLQTSGKQSHFLLSAYPPSCPYCLPAGANELIEVTDAETIKFTYDPITIHGIFHLLSGNELKESGTFYRMTNVHKS